MASSPEVVDAVEPPAAEAPVDVEAPTEKTPEATKGGSQRWKKGLAGCCCVCYCCCPPLIFLIIYLALVAVITDTAIGQMVTLDEVQSMGFCEQGLDMANMTYNIWWPGCDVVSSMSDLNNSCTKPCFNASLVEAMQELNARIPGKRVTYPSRTADGVETVQLGGWVLPAEPSMVPSGTTAPRIVLQHGFKANSNMWRIQLFAYMMRSLGFDVLVNNLRDHCYSEKSENHIYEWGHGYVYDLLGAWDYAVNDPDNVFGGSVSPSKVGILGKSLGGFLSTIAFGLEGNVPGVLVDGPPLTPKAVFAHGLRNQLEGMGLAAMTDVILPPVWQNTENAAKEKGVDLNYHLPEAVLPQGPDSKRPIFVAYNELDSTVPASESQGLIELLKEYPEKYKVEGVFVSDETCNGQDHIVDHLRDFDVYRSKACRFWTSVFGLGQSRC